MKNRIYYLVFLILILLIVSILFVWATPHIPYSTLIAKFRWNKYLSLILVGGLLGIGSYVTQLLTGNKKADVSTLGIGALNILMVIIILLATSIETLILWKNNWLIALIFCSSIIGSLILMRLTKRVFRNTNNILIMGIILTLFTSALAYLIIDKMEIRNQEEIANYLVGSILINKQVFNVAQLVGIIVLVSSMIWLFIFGEKLILIISNEDKAKSLGIHVFMHRMIAIMIIAFCASAAFVIAGNVMFIGFAIGNINYLIFRKSTKFSSLGVVIIGAISALFAYWLFHEILDFKIYEGIYIMIFSGALLLITTIIERTLRWKNQS